MFSLKDKIALVTGATGDIGLSIVKNLQAQQVKVFASGTNEEKLNKLSNSLAIQTKACDLRDLSAVEALVEEVIKVFGRIDILVCNAGITKDSLAVRMKNQDFAEVIDVNLKANFVLNRTAIKHMMRGKTGRIINIASIVGVMGNPGQANYCASKAGLIGMSKSLAAEAASRGITVNCIAPGFIETAMTSKLNPQQRERLGALIPGGNFGKPEDVANCVAFLASDESSYINGHTLHVNGGMLMV